MKKFKLFNWSFLPLIMFILICVLVIVVFNTHLGLNWAIQVIQKNIPGTLSYEKMTGNLEGKINIHGFKYQDGDCTLQIKTIHLQTDVHYLLFKQLHFKQLTANNIQFYCPKLNAELLTSPDNFSFTKIQADQFDLSKIIIGTTPKNILTQLSFIRGQLLIGASQIKTHLTINLLQPIPLTNTIDIDGPIDRYNILWTLNNPHFNWIAKGQGGTSWLTLSTEKAATLGATAHVNISLDWAEDLNWQTAIDIEHLNLAKIFNKGPNDVNLEMKSKGRWLKDHPEFSIAAKLKTPQINFDIQGNRSLDWNLHWRLNTENLASLLPNSSGSIQSQGKVIGPSKKPHIIGDVIGRQIKFGSYQATQFYSNWDVDLSHQFSSFLNLHAIHLKTPYDVLQALSIHLQSTPNLKNIQLNGKIVSNQHTLKMRLNADGELKNKIWQGMLNQVNLESEKIGFWNLSNPAPITFAKNKIIFSNICIQSQQGNLCATGEWHHEHPWSITINSQQLPLALITQWSPHLKVESPANLSIQMTGEKKKITTSKINFNLKKGFIDYTSIPKHLKKIIPFENASVQSELNREGLTFNIRSKVLHQGKMSGKIYLPAFRPFSFQKQQKIAGAVDINFANLDFIKTILPPLMQPQGQLSSRFTISGTFAHPLINGKLILKQGIIQIPLLHLTLSRITMDVNIQDDQLHYRIVGYTGKNPIEIIGHTDLNQSKLSSEFIIKGTQVLVLNTMEYKIFASGELHIHIQKPKIYITGNVLIPEALLHPMDLNTGDTLPDEIVYVGENNVAASNWQTIVNVKITLGNDVRINSFGLEGLIRGQFILNREPNRDFISNGRLILLDGTFLTHGRKLIIDPNSSIVFANSPLNNPNLNVRVLREIKLAPTMQLSPILSTQFYTQDILTVGLDIQGTLRRPHTSLYATNPNLSQADILSYLILSHAASANSPGDVSLLVDAINSLKIGKDTAKPGGIIDQITQGLGLSEFGIESTQTFDILGTPLGQEESSFVVGRYFSPRLYVRYSSAISNSLNIIQLRYLFNNHWSIQTDSSTQGTGADILYSFQRK